VSSPDSAARCVRRPWLGTGFQLFVAFTLTVGQFLGHRDHQPDEQVAGRAFWIRQTFALEAEYFARLGTSRHFDFHSSINGRHFHGGAQGSIRKIEVQFVDQVHTIALQVIVPTYYAQVLGLSLSAIGGVGWSFSLNYLSDSNVDDVLGLGFNFPQNMVLEEDTNFVELLRGNNTQGERFDEVTTDICRFLDGKRIEVL